MLHAEMHLKGSNSRDFLEKAVYECDTEVYNIKIQYLMRNLSRRLDKMVSSNPHYSMIYESISYFDH